MSLPGPTSNDLAEAEGLVNHLLDDELPPAGADRLEELLRERADVRRYYVLQMHLWCSSMPYAIHAGDADDLARVDDQSAAAEMSDAMILPAIRDAEPDELSTGPARIAAPPSQGRHGLQNWRIRATAAAVGIVLVLGGILASQLGHGPAQTPQTPPAVAKADPRPDPIPPPSPAPLPPATLTAAVDAQWDDPNGAIELGGPMPSGSITLKTGLAEVRFRTGVGVVIQAPAKFKIQSDTTIRLDLGKLTAAVPVSAHGFTVKTASVRAVDLGTEFGVEVLPNQQSHVEVFKGMVTAQAGAKGAKTLIQTLSKGQAVAVSAGSASIQSVAPKPLEFVRQSQMAAEADRAVDARYQRWRAFSGTLRDDPALVAYYLFDNSAESQTVPNRAPQTQGILDGTFRPGSDGSSPAPAAGRWPLKPALRFNGTGGRIIVNDDPALHLSGRATLLAWVKPDSGARLMGYPRIISKKLTYDADAGFEMYLSRWEAAGAGFDVNLDGKPKASFFSRFSAPVLLDGQWHLLAGVIEGPDSFARGYVDGVEMQLHRPAGPSDAGAAPGTLIPTDAPLMIGADAANNHFFNGVVDEIAILSRALSGEEVAAAFRNGRP